jgi:UDPglucose 6-dehydrogenase
MREDQVIVRRISVIGSGHVGLVTGACLAELGNSIVCVDDDPQKIAMLERGEMPFFEPGLTELVRRNRDQGRLSFTTNAEEGCKGSSIAFICVGTPQGRGGEADPSYVEAAAKRLAEVMDGYMVVVEKSTVPVMTGKWVKKTMQLSNRHNREFDVVSNPEFLREGKAIYDFMHPDRIVIGTESQRAADLMVDLYKPLGAPVMVTNLETAELIKHASNVFLAVKVSYINVVADICEKTGADVVKVAEGMGYDKRIGRGFLDAGIGYGGYCLPKDLAAFINIARRLGCDPALLAAVQQVNDSRAEVLAGKLKKAVWNLSGKTVGVLGLAYKPDTDDMREAPSVRVIGILQEEGVHVKACDPQAVGNARKILKDVQYCETPYEAAEGSDALVIVTEWEEFKNLDLAKIKTLLRQPVIVDGRNIFDPVKMKEMGFDYHGMGR